MNHCTMLALLLVPALASAADTTKAADTAPASDADQQVSHMFHVSAATYEPEQLISVPVPYLILSTTPLLFIAYLSWRHDLELASPVIVSIIRAFIQLNLLGYILDPIFAYGVDYFYIVFLYVCFMVILAAREASNRTKYSFAGMPYTLLAALLINVSVVGVWAFGVIIKPTPFFSPQYVIPICGMLLGNSINGLSLSLNSILTSLVEQQREVELYLSFGANRWEASNRLMRQALRAGTTPTINGMAIIGLISIPGMMTGQILGGSSIIDAARYQILITYLIATCVFGSTFMLLYVSIKVGFDATQMLRLDRIFKRTQKSSIFDCISDIFRMLFCCCCDMAMENDGSALGKKPAALSNAEETKALTDTGHSSTSFGTNGGSSNNYRSTDTRSLEVLPLKQNSSTNKTSSLELRGVQRSVPIDERNQSRDAPRRVLFHDMNLTVSGGEIAALRGPSGCGKSQLLRVIAGLSSADEGEFELGSTGVCRMPGTDWTSWRRDVRYVTQFKVDVQETPSKFAHRVASFKAHKAAKDAPTAEDMILNAGDLIEKWGMPRSSLEKDWTFLSGGEAQRVILAMAMASRPRVILLDETTSALDMDSKLQVERSILDLASQNDVSVILVTHDHDQLNRLTGE